MQYHIQRGRTVNGTAYMDFKTATDRLFAPVDHGDLARQLGVSVSTIRQARLRSEARARRSPPPRWREAVIALAEERAAHYAKLLDEMKADEAAVRAAHPRALRQMDGLTTR